MGQEIPDLFSSYSCLPFCSTAICPAARAGNTKPGFVPVPRPSPVPCMWGTGSASLLSLPLLGGAHCSDTPTLHSIQERGLGLQLNPITGHSKGDKGRKREAQCSSHRQRPPSGSSKHPQNMACALGGGGRSQPVPLQSPPWGPGGDALWDRMGCLSPDPAF